MDCGMLICTVNLMFGLSIPIPNAFVATSSRSSLCLKRCWTSSRLTISLAVRLPAYIVATMYAGSLTANDMVNLEEVQQRFKHNELRLLVATKAFGMGIDKPNIRFTVHINMPQSIESFYQEAGRAGRDRN